MGNKTAVLISDNANDLEALEGAIKHVDPSLFCMSFIYADEAVKVVSEELKSFPNYIFINMNMRRMTGTECLAQLSAIKMFSNCKIVLFSLVMPPVVADAYKTMGADYAFQRPVSDQDYNEMISSIFNG